jgi:hypothetical protein
MGGVAECSWVRVHPIPLNQFTLFPIIPIYMVSTIHYESENQMFVFILFYFNLDLDLDLWS